MRFWNRRGFELKLRWGFRLRHRDWNWYWYWFGLGCRLRLFRKNKYGDIDRRSRRCSRFCRGRGGLRSRRRRTRVGRYQTAQQIAGMWPLR